MPLAETAFALEVQQDDLVDKRAAARDAEKRRRRAAEFAARQGALPIDGKKG